MLQPGHPGDIAVLALPHGNMDAADGNIVAASLL
jgi:hypothetical protein